MTDKFSPYEKIENSIRHWWVIVLFMLAGAGTGYLIYQNRSPVYEAQAVFSNSIDYSRTGMLTEYDQDQILILVNDIIDSTEVREEVVRAANAEGINIDMNTFLENSYTESKRNLWVLRVRNPDPDSTARIANLWAEISNEKIQEAYRHALIAAELQRYLDSLESCMGHLIVSEPVMGQCSPGNLPSLSVELQKTGVEVKKEKLSAKGLIPGLVSTLSVKAEIPLIPVNNQANIMLLAGAVAGFVIALFLVELQIPLQLKSWIKRA